MTSTRASDIVVEEIQIKAPVVRIEAGPNS